MNSYEAKQAAKKNRFEERAKSVQAEAAATHARARQMAEAIPFGQPILGRVNTNFGAHRPRGRS